MSDEVERLSELLDRLAAERDPLVEGPPSAAELELIEVAASLKAARPAALAPEPAFVDRLGAQLAAARRNGETGAARARKTRGVPRRTLLGGVAAAVAGLALGTGAGAAAAYNQGKRDGYLDEEREAYTVPMVPADRGAWLDTGMLAETLAPGQAMRFRAGAIEGFLINPGAAEPIYALSAACTHMGCMLSWLDSAGTFLCPCHGAQYSADGTVLSGIARHPLPRLQLRQDTSGRLLVWSVTEHPGNSSLAPYSGT